MELQSLSMLVEILDAGNLSEAARRLKMSRANVSYHLNQFERAVGQQLVRRTTRRIEPTEIGLRLYEHGRQIRNELEAARETVTTLGQTLQGRVRLSVPSGYGQLVMAPWLIDFKRAYPGIVLDVVFENRVDNLRDDVDIAVRILPEPPQQLVARDMGTVRYLACAARTYADSHGLPTQLAQLGTLPLVTANVVGRQLSLRGYRGSEREEVQLAPSLISDHYPFLRQCVLAGLGLGLLPDYVVQDVIATGEVVTALDDYRLSIFGTRMYLLTMPNRHQTRAVRTCIDFLLARAKGKSPRP